MAANLETRMKKQYKTPLRSRKAMLSYLLNRGGRWQSRGGMDYDRRSWRFCFNVKLNRVDLEFDHLLKLELERDPIQDRLRDEHFLLEARALLNAERLCEAAIEQLCWHYSDVMTKHVCLPDGTQVFPEFQFMGRSGGWLVLTRFNGYALTAEEEFEAWSTMEIRNLYRYVVQVEEDLNCEPKERQVEREAAYLFFQHICEDIMTKQQQEEAWIASDQSGEH